MNILIIGSGGREHSLGWKLKKSRRVKKLFFAPGNGGTAQLGENIDMKATDIKAITSFVIQNNIGLTVVGPEDPLSLGIVDTFEKKRLRIFGPSKQAARLEVSKKWAAGFMKKYHIPQPAFHVFNNYEKACFFIDTHDISQFVIKASGLALGKGVILPRTKKEALKAIKRIMVNREFGEAGNEVVIQEKLFGREVSIMAISDGKTVIPLLPAQDHKRIFDNDKGPNTGGMGAYAPVPFITEKLTKEIQKTILQPTIDGMRKEKCPFKGILYAGLMITETGPKVLEFNVRFGDPEVQPLMMLLKSDLVPLLLSSVNEKLHKARIVFHKAASICIVLASKGYPGTYDKGEILYGLDKKYSSGTNVFHAGTTIKNTQIVTNGGRVVGITTIGNSIKTAIRKAYSAIGKKGVYFKGMQYRTDIGKAAITSGNMKRQ